MPSASRDGQWLHWVTALLRLHGSAECRNPINQSSPSCMMTWGRPPCQHGNFQSPRPATVSQPRRSAEGPALAGLTWPVARVIDSVYHATAL
ncbi:hypothetical protein SKAU_G00073830 [Synaphobranchus kaupii]|uniref:Secreted protein n=1 Tax=Synaphobranchus kaupii TaxID=118154 RepID=A0A9Q1JBK0_SYNKA|nr:hypothetical protein SKAU_G00073830 [Synaphobranchus kaupii]